MLFNVIGLSLICGYTYMSGLHSLRLPEAINDVVRGITVFSFNIYSNFTLYLTKHGFQLTYDELVIVQK